MYTKIYLIIIESKIVSSVENQITPPTLLRVKRPNPITISEADRAVLRVCASIDIKQSAQWPNYREKEQSCSPVNCNHYHHHYHHLASIADVGTLVLFSDQLGL